ncbi:MAG: YicC/YloC family endoribonuclease [Rhodovibrionaceae bacterium]
MSTAASPAIQSMTGFARSQGANALAEWSWEVKSVNGKSLDARFRVPSGYESLEQSGRAALAARFKRGNFQLALTLRQQIEPEVHLNRAALDSVMALVGRLRQEGIEADPPRLDGLLQLRGVIETQERELAAEEFLALEAELLAALETALDELAEVRAAEGAKLLQLAEAQLAEIERLRSAASGMAATQPEALRARLRQQVEELLQSAASLDSDRLYQEAALLATKADIREELDRLAAHVEAARALLASGEAVGRKLDFLCQEFNREANTLCSKSQDVALTRLGLDLKSSIEQLREQVQNLE